jgi:hypothetical protein
MGLPSGPPRPIPKPPPRPKPDRTIDLKLALKAIEQNERLGLISSADAVLQRIDLFRQLPKCQITQTVTLDDGPHDKKVWGIWIPSIKKWVCFTNGAIFWTTSRAVARIQLEDFRSKEARVRAFPKT